MAEQIQLDFKDAKYKIWNKQKKKWFYLVEKKSSFPFSQFLVEDKKNGDLYLAMSLHSAPWLWGEVVEIHNQDNERCIKKDKPVLINNVDVSRCGKFLPPNGCDNLECDSCECDSNQDCEHKQLIKNIEVSECEWAREIELDSHLICTGNFKNKVSGYCEDNQDCPYRKYLHKQQECDRLQTNLIESQCKCSILKEQLNGTNFLCGEFLKLYGKLEQVIIEAEQLLRTVCEEECGEKPDDCADSDCRYNQIFQKLQERY